MSGNFSLADVDKKCTRCNGLGAVSLDMLYQRMDWDDFIEDALTPLPPSVAPCPVCRSDARKAFNINILGISVE